MHSPMAANPAITSAIGVAGLNSLSLWAGQ
jgi:hypothetical protein